MTTGEIRENTTIQFYYNNRIIIVDVLIVDTKIIIGKLRTNYIGKNEDWYIGEEKHFLKSLMKNVKTPNP